MLGIKWICHNFLTFFEEGIYSDCWLLQTIILQTILYRYADTHMQECSRAVALRGWPMHPAVLQTPSWSLWDQVIFIVAFGCHLFSLLYLCLHSRGKHTAEENCILTWIKAVARKRLDHQYILHCHVFTGKKWPILLQHVLGEVTVKLQIKCCTSDTHLFVIWVMSWSCVHKELTLPVEGQWLPEQEHSCGSFRHELQWLWITMFTCKDAWLANYGCSDLDIGQMFSLKWKKCKTTDNVCRNDKIWPFNSN